MTLWQLLNVLVLLVLLVLDINDIHYYLSQVATLPLIGSYATYTSNALAHATLNYLLSLFVAAIPLVLYSRGTSIRLLLALVLLILFTQYQYTESIYLSLAGITGSFNFNMPDNPNHGKKYFKALNMFLISLNSRGIAHYTSPVELHLTATLSDLKGFGVTEPLSFFMGMDSNWKEECLVQNSLDPSGQSHYNAFVKAIDYQCAARPRDLFALMELQNYAKRIFLEMPKNI